MTIDATTMLIAFLLGLLGVGLLALLLETVLMLHSLVKHQEWAPAGLLAAVLLVIGGLVVLGIVVGPPPPATAPIDANVCDLPGVYTDHYRPETKASLCARLDHGTPTTVVMHTTTSGSGR